MTLITSEAPASVSAPVYFSEEEYDTFKQKHLRGVKHDNNTATHHFDRAHPDDNGLFSPLSLPTSTKGMRAVRSMRRSAIEEEFTLHGCKNLAMLRRLYSEHCPANMQVKVAEEIDYNAPCSEGVLKDTLRPVVVYHMLAA